MLHHNQNNKKKRKGRRHKNVDNNVCVTVRYYSRKGNTREPSHTSLQWARKRSRLQFCAVKMATMQFPRCGLQLYGYG